MNKEFVPYEQALALKELGFDEPCFGRYWNGELKILMFSEQFINPSHVALAPTFFQAFRWFREKYGLPSWIYTSNNKEYWYSVLKDGRMLVRDYKPFETYEEAELACLKKLIEIVKQ